MPQWVPEAERICCWFHKMKNVLEVPDEMYTTIERLLQDVRDAADYETGKQRADALIEQYKRQLASATAALADDLEASLTHLKLPVLHRRMVRTTNLCERAFGERRRSKVTPRSSAVQLGVTPCNTRATPCYAVT